MLFYATFHFCSLFLFVYMHTRDLVFGRSQVKAQQQPDDWIITLRMVNDLIPPLAKHILGRIDAECDVFFFLFFVRGDIVHWFSSHLNAFLFILRSDDYLDKWLIGLSNFLRIKVTILWFQPLKCEHFLVSLVLYIGEGVGHDPKTWESVFGPTWPPGRLHSTFYFFTTQYNETCLIFTSVNFFYTEL